MESINLRERERERTTLISIDTRAANLSACSVVTTDRVPTVYLLQPTYFTGELSVTYSRDVNALRIFTVTLCAHKPFSLLVLPLISALRYERNKPATANPDFGWTCINISMGCSFYHRYPDQPRAAVISCCTVATAAVTDCRSGSHRSCWTDEQ